MTTPDCTDVRALLADHLDGLLERADAERVEAHLAACVVCAVAAGQARTLRTALSTPWTVADAPGDLPQRARAAYARAPGQRGRAAAVALRYVATFAAGVLATLLVLHPESPAPVPPSTLAAAPAPAATEPPEAATVSPTPRRIR